MVDYYYHSNNSHNSNIYHYGRIDLSNIDTNKYINQLLIIKKKKKKKKKRNILIVTYFLTIKKYTINMIYMFNNFIKKIS